MVRQIGRILILLLLFSMLAACGGVQDADSTPFPTDTPAANVLRRAGSTPVAGDSGALATNTPAAAGDTLGQPSATAVQLAESGATPTLTKPTEFVPRDGSETATPTTALDIAVASATPTASATATLAAGETRESAENTPTPTSAASATPTARAGAPTATATPQRGTPPPGLATPTPVQQPTVTPTPPVPLADRVTNTLGFFSLRPPASYDIDVLDESIVMAPPDTNPFSGPVLFASGERNAVGETLSDVITRLQAEITDAAGTFDPATDIVVDGVSGRTFTYTYPFGEDQVAGAYAALVTAEQIVTMSGYAAPTSWQSDVAQQFYAVVNTIQLLDPNAEPEPLADVVWRFGGASSAAPGGLSEPQGMALDEANGRLYVADGVHGIVVLSLSGSYLDEFAQSAWEGPVDVALSAAGTLFVADSGGSIYELSVNGALLKVIGGLGTGNGQFGDAGPLAVTVAADGTLYALDENETSGGDAVTRVQVFSASGAFMRTFTVNPATEPAIVDLIAEPGGTLALLDYENEQIYRYTTAGVLATTIGAEALSNTLPEGLAVDSAGNLYAVTTNPAQAHRLTPGGALTDSYGVDIWDGFLAWGAGGFYLPEGIVVTGDGSLVFVTDWSGDFAYVTAFTFDP